MSVTSTPLVVRPERQVVPQGPDRRDRLTRGRAVAPVAHLEISHEGGLLSEEVVLLS